MRLRKIRKHTTLVSFLLFHAQNLLDKCILWALQWGTTSVKSCGILRRKPYTTRNLNLKSCFYTAACTISKCPLDLSIFQGVNRPGHVIWGCGWQGKKNKSYQSSSEILRAISLTVDIMNTYNGLHYCAWKDIGYWCQVTLPLAFFVGWLFLTL